MSTQQARGGIERKILTSILWVGVIPMGLALLIGWIFAYQGQQLAVSQELNTAARTVAGGVELALEERLRELEAITENAFFLRIMTEMKDGIEATPGQIDTVFQIAEQLLGPEESAYFLYDAKGKLIHESRHLTHTDHPNLYHALGPITDSQYLGFGYVAEFKSYADHLVAPVWSDDGEVFLGYLETIRKNNDVLNYLYSLNNPNVPVGDENTYALIHVGNSEGEDMDYVIQWDVAQNELNSEPEQQKLDRRLAQKIRENRDTASQFTAIMKFRAPEGEQDAFMTYHLLDPYENLYLLVFRTRADVVRYINFAAIVTLFVSLLVIGLFCIIAYRIVNHNIIRPVSLLNEGAQIIRQGDLELKLKIDTQDEIEELAMSFNQMAAALKQNIYEMEESEERYRSLITSMRDGIFQTDIPGNIALVNPAGVMILGYQSADELTGTTLKELFVEEIDYARVSNELLRNQYIERTRVWIKKRKAPSVCIELAINRIYDDEGEYVGMEGTFRDVTQNVQLERESRERSERISAINQIANVINSSLEAGRVFDSIVVEVRKLIAFDYAAVALLEEQSTHFETRQLWPEALKTDKSVRIDREGSCAAWVAQERQCLVIGDLGKDFSEFEGQFPEYINSCLCVPLYATGRIVGTLNLGAKALGAFSPHEVEVLEQMAPHVAVAIRNARLMENLQVSLEEVTRAREKLHEVNEELKTLDDLKTNLLSNVSHELRTPLVAVMGYTDMILNGKVGPVNDVQMEYLQISLRNIEKLVTLIENLLDFSKLHRGDEDLLFDTFDLVDCAENALQTVKPVADSRKISTIMDVPDEPVLVEGDKGKMGQVFINLLSNAVKFNENGGSVTIKMKISDDTVDVSVTDTGIGIPEEKQDKIFTRFYQVDGSSTRKYGGTGIGLSIAQDIMRLHGASIVFNSAPGEGTTFRFILPLSMKHRRSAEEIESGLPLPTETHLLVELVTQDRAMSTQIRSLLLSEGMDVIHAAYPAMAVQLANKYSPDCILVDSEAGPIGSIVVDEILSDPFAASFPIVLLTNDNSLQDKYKDRIASSIQRSFRKSTLLSGIHYALSKGVVEGAQLGNKVLCVDDDPVIVSFITRCLEAEGLGTDKCGSGEEALEKLLTLDYWLVLLDISMPGMDGWETCKRIKEEATLAGIHVYFVTAKPIEKHINKVHECGAHGYLLKPFKPEELMTIIDGYEWRQSGDIGSTMAEAEVVETLHEEDVAEDAPDA